MLRRALPAACSAFVAGNLLLNACAALPGWRALAALVCAAAMAFLAAALLHRRCATGAGPVRVYSLAAVLSLVTGSLLLGVVFTGWRASTALEESLPVLAQHHPYRVRGVIVSLPSVSERDQRFTFQLESIDGEPVPAHFPHLIAVGWALPAPTGKAPDGAGGATLPTLRAAQRWELPLILKPVHGLVNPAGFDLESWLLEQGIRAQASVASGHQAPAPRLLDEPVMAFTPLVNRWRGAVRTELARRLGEQRASGVVIALVMGDQGAIAPADWTLFNQTGVSHLISISGLHITMIAALCAMAARVPWRRIPFLFHHVPLPAVRAIAGLSGAYAYCLLAGWGVPAQRTLLMLAVVAVARCTRANPGLALTLSGAGAAVCLWDPWACLNAGFWLSFGAVALILAMVHGDHPPLRHGLPRLRSAIRLQLAISLGQIPLTAAIFGQVSLISPVANAVAIPLVSFVVAPLALLGAALAMLRGMPAWVADAPLHAAQGLFSALTTLLETLTRLPFASLSLAQPPAWTLALSVAAAVWAVQPPGWPLRAGAVILLACLLCWPAQRPRPGALWVTALDVGQGMALVLETDRHVLVFDTGPRFGPDSDAASRVILPYLHARGHGDVDLLVVSHADLDHAGGAASLARAIRVHQVWTSVRPEHPLLQGVPHGTRCEQGQTASLDDLSLQVLSPAPAVYDNPRSSSNAHSCVVLVRLAGNAVMLTGDVPAREERALVRWANSAGVDLKADLLVAPHHGSHSSSSAEFIDATRPRWVSMQMGFGNRFGHPAESVIERYRQRAIPVFRSDRLGAVRWQLEQGRPVRIERWRIDHARYWYQAPEADAAAVRSSPSEAEPPDSTMQATSEASDTSLTP